jgi:hypothetical protein
MAMPFYLGVALIVKLDGGDARSDAQNIAYIKGNIHLRRHLAAADARKGALIPSFDKP